MKKIHFYSFVLCCLFAISSCITPKTAEVTPAGKYSSGVLILNEGNFSQSNGNVSFYNHSTREVFADIIKTENSGVALNALIQNAVDADGKTFIVTNSPDQLVILNGTTFKSEGVVSTGLANPFDVAVANGKAYVTEWGANYWPTYSNASIRIINAATRQATSFIAVGKEISSIVAHNGKVYAAITGDNKIWVINPTTDVVEAQITVANSPSNMVIDANGKMWVLCSSGNLVRLNLATNTVEATVTGVSISGYSEKITINDTRDKLYWLGSSAAGFTGVGIFQMTIANTIAPTSPLVIGSTFYGIGFSSVGNEIVAGVAPTFSSNGQVLFYSVNGGSSRTIGSNGVAPNGFLVR